MVKAHNKSRPELSAMKVAELKALVRTHNLDNAIRRYSSMKKSELVDALVKHSSGEKAAAKKPAPKPAPKPAATKPAAKKPAAKKPAAKKPAPKKRKLEIEKEKETPAPKKKPAAKEPAPKRAPYESYFLERFRDIVGDFLQLKKILLARKRKVGPGLQVAIGEQVKRLEKFIKMDKFAGPKAKASTESDRYLKLPTSEELGFLATRFGSDTMINKTRSAVTAFIKAREKSLTDFIPLIKEGIERHNKEPAEVVPKKKTPTARAAPKTDAVSAASFRSGFGFGSTSDRLSSMGISPLFAGLFKD